MKLFALNSSKAFGEEVAQVMGVSLSLHSEEEFEDGEHQCRPLESVRNEDVYVIHSLYADAAQTINDKLCRLLFFIGALKDASAKSVTAVVPYLCYARKDQKSEPRGPVTTRYIATLFEAVGVDRVVTIDVHDLPAYQNAFRCPTENLEAKALFADHFCNTLKDEQIVILSPDIGGVKRAEHFQKLLAKRLQKEISIAFKEKYRKKGVVSGATIIGDVKDKTVIIIDDMISTGTTMAQAAEAAKKCGARSVLAAVTHGLFSGRAPEVLEHQDLEEIIITNTIPPFRLENTGVKNKITVISAAPLFAEVIRRIQQGGSVWELLQD